MSAHVLTGSVHAWNRVGQFLQEAALHILCMPTGRWVDDFFAVEPNEIAGHAMACFNRLVVALMGVGSIAPDKLSCGNPIDLLGLTVSIRDGHIVVCPNEQKLQRWLGDVSLALSTRRLKRQQAEKLAGRLSFTAQNAFHKLGRAMLRPLYQQQHRPLHRGAMRPLLLMSLKWWQQVLQNRRWQTKRLGARTEVVHIFCDAASTPAKAAAVFMSDSVLAFTDWVPPAKLLEELEPRKDQQICALELMAIVLGKYSRYTVRSSCVHRSHVSCIFRSQHVP